VTLPELPLPPVAAARSLACFLHPVGEQFTQSVCEVSLRFLDAFALRMKANAATSPGISTTLAQARNFGFSSFRGVSSDGAVAFAVSMNPGL
jgi:hypothetical protein